MAPAAIRRSWRTIPIDQPAVGVDFVITPPGGVIWRVISMVARLVTSAVVANRLGVFVADNTERAWWKGSAGAFETASSTIDYALHTGVSSPSTGGSVFYIPVPVQGLLLRPSNRLRSTVTALDVGDQWANIMLLVEEIPSGPDYWGDELLPPSPIELG